MASPKNWRKVKEGKYKSKWRHEDGGHVYIVKRSNSGKWVAGVSDPSMSSRGNISMLSFSNRDDARSYIVQWMRDNPNP